MRRLPVVLISGALAWTLLPAHSPPVDAQLAPGTPDARAVMQAVRDRDVGDRAAGRVRMTITDASGGRRERVMRTRAMESGEGNRTLLLFESPADIRDTGLLTHDHDDPARDDDQWLYLPSLHRTTRITTATRSGAFVGSDLSFADLTVPDPDDYELAMRDPRAEIDGRPCWHIEATPRSSLVAAETGYARSEIWVDQATLLPVRTKAWLRRGGRIKFLALRDLRQVDGVWVAFRVTARTVRAGQLESETVLEQLALRFGDPAVTEGDFTPRRLEQGL